MKKQRYNLDLIDMNANNFHYLGLHVVKFEML